jgi:signal transduction histidine kinase/CheY-like chemotaxis protein
MARDGQPQREGQGEGRVYRIFAAGVALVAALLLIGLVIMVDRSNRARDAALAAERHSYDVIFATTSLRGAMSASEAALGRFVISGDKQVGSIYADEWRRAGVLLARLRTLTADNPGQSALMDDLDALYEQRGKELAEPAIRANYRQGLPALSLFYRAGESETVPRIATILRKLTQNERDLLAQRANLASASVAQSNWMAGLLSVLGIALAVCAVGLGVAAWRAMTVGQAAGRQLRREMARANSLEVSVASRTLELENANERLRREALERAATEAQLRQAQKMEAVGQLTGGIAHDFNNMLAVVVGGLELARRRVLDGQTELVRNLDSALEGANRAAALTRRLLAFARAEPLLPETVEPGRLVAGMSDLFDRTLGERIVVETRLSSRLWPVWVDPHQLENALLNLAVNARDAMDGAGRLTIAAENVAVRAGEFGQAPAGQYVRIAVQDTGAGMPREVLDRVFEPFFTTKPVGKGTGLGLSQIFGFVRQSGGEIAIESHPGEGTSVSFLLPRRIERASGPVTAPAPPVPRPCGPPPKTPILLVEDDQRVRAATLAALRELGHEALSCDEGEAALALLAKRPDIQIVISDVVMPGMSGPELIRAAVRLYPDLAVLFVTGYVGEGEAQALTGYEILRKPFTIAGLEAALARAFSARRPAEAASAAE